MSKCAFTDVRRSVAIGEVVQTAKGQTVDRGNSGSGQNADQGRGARERVGA